MPYCVNCGHEISPVAVACPQCGHPGPRAGPVVTAAPGKRTEGFAIASLICSAGSFFFLPVVGAILGIVFGHTARRRIAEDPTLGGQELARAGIIVGWIALGVSLAFILFLFLITIAWQGWHF